MHAQHFFIAGSSSDYCRFLISDALARIRLIIACEQALLFGHAKQALRERANEGPRKGELATISYKFSFPPRKPRDSAKRVNCQRKRAAD